ncbi:MAG: tetratricopeptide repeat protein, partial [Chthonomonadaceae bacterium]|nr:tetratricopeptide repeat protein [Chthonomonadaceae bacterium]
AAYEVLSDENKRQQYDRYGHEGVNGEVDAGVEEVEQIVQRTQTRVPAWALEIGPPAPEEAKQIVQQARTIAAQGDWQTAINQLGFAFQYDVSSDLVLDACCDLLEKAFHANQHAGTSAELELFRRIRDYRDDPEAYYGVANHFFQVGQAFLAHPFYVRARQLNGAAETPLAQMLDVEHAQVLMELGEYQQAVDLFQKLNDRYGGLPVELILKMAECYALLREVEAAEALLDVIPEEGLEQSPGLAEWHEEVGDLIARIQDFADREVLGLREWHYVQTRGILLETNPDESVPGERFFFFQPSEEDVAYVVGLTASILDEMGYTPDRILYLGSSSEPLAHLFAEWWGRSEEDVRFYQPGDNTDRPEPLSLLVMAHSYDYGGLITEEDLQRVGDDPQAMHLLQMQRLSELAEAREGLILFMLDVRWTERQPITPDIAGFLTQQCNLPWEPRLQVDMEQQVATPVQETRDVRTIVRDLSAQFPSREECRQWAKETLEEYAGCSDLMLNHRDGTLKRKSLVTHSPVKSPRFGY